MTAHTHTHSQSSVNPELCPGLVGSPSYVNKTVSIQPDWPTFPPHKQQLLSSEHMKLYEGRNQIMKVEFLPEVCLETEKS